MHIRPYTPEDLPALIEIWNEVVEDGEAFPQVTPLDAVSGAAFFAAQTRTAAAVDDADGTLLGLYILHPNNEGRCGHIANASYAVRRTCRDRHVGEQLVRDSLAAARAAGFRLMQFNAVVASNTRARHLYERLGFRPLGVIPGGFRMPDGHYEDICPYYYDLCAGPDSPDRIPKERVK